MAIYIWDHEGFVDRFLYQPPFLDNDCQHQLVHTSTVSPIIYYLPPTQVRNLYTKTKLELLSNLVPPNENTRIRSNDELADELRRCLLRKRYFIVIDDLWSTDTWDDLKRCFPDNYSGSRIILTTRQEKVASYTKVFSAPHRLRLFTDEESWFLLQKNVFGEESCPPKLDVIGMQIAQYCGGLPLAIILVAGVLAKLDKDEVCWEEVAYDLSSCISGDKQKYMDIINLSLPNHLTNGFLYFGKHFEDEILVRELIQLWIAEEFVVDSNLVMVVRRNFFGEVKAIGMHDLLREFCLTRCKSYRSSNSTAAEHERGISLDFRYNYKEAEYLYPHSAISRIPYSVDDILEQNNFLIFNCKSLCFKPIITSLRVLDLVCVTSSNAPYIQFLINLRYLSMKGNFEEDPSWLSNLKYLKTLILRESRRLDLSYAIWGYGRLENLEVLKLESNAFEGDQQWDVDNEEFQNLKFLMFYNMNIPQWNFSDMFFPNLQHLIFRNSRLKTIPRDFENLLLLQMIEVSWCKCSRDALNTAEEIKKTQTDMGNHEFKLIIKSREDDDHEEEDEDDHEDAHQKKYFFFFVLALFLIIFQHFFQLIEEMKLS
ncbi:hypothetical protein H5410_025076 [Solanum commersonii]|uniref:NB-ARC domain-containing protein n=1 Tax=Solanum commersonii TaxID=4109 RepID=A0A9J5YUW7_SOLCO|nr:hypothetical protein H5410_025076 [Solanum commersonii]